MITVLEYLVIAAVIGLVVFVIAVFVFGRGEQMAALSPRTSPSELPDDAIGGDDIRRLRFGLALRGYRMSDVDWALDRMSDELDRLHRRVSELTGDPLPAGVPAHLDEDNLFRAPGDSTADQTSAYEETGADEQTGAHQETGAADPAAGQPAPNESAEQHASVQHASVQPAPEVPPVDEQEPDGFGNHAADPGRPLGRHAAGRSAAHGSGAASR